MLSPIAGEDVAAGEGALQTFIIFLSSKIKKSSERFPLLSQAWARTPALPTSKSSFLISGLTQVTVVLPI